MRSLLACLAFLLAAPSGLAAALEPVTLQLKWKHQFQFAGYYVAAEKGYYREAGFEVRIAEATGEDTADVVLSGRAHYGVAGSELALRRALGDPVVALATVLQHSALALAARGGTRLTVQDLKGRRVMLSPHDQELLAYLQREGLSGGRVQQVPPSFDIQDLIGGKVDAFSVYTTDQVWQLRKAGLPHTVLSPRSAGIDFYGDTLYTTEQRVRAEPQRVRAFRDASLRGWGYAMDHPEETADLILARYSRRLEREHLLFEAAEMQRLMQPQLIEVGHMNPARWHHVATVYAELGMLPRDFTLDGFLFDDAARGAPLERWKWLALVAAALVLLAGAWRFAAGRRAAVAPDPAAAAQAAPAPALRDAQTGLFSAAYLHETLPRDLDRALARGERLHLAWLVPFGEAQGLGAQMPGTGDALLAGVGTLLSAHLGPGEYACRAADGAIAWVMLPGAAGPAGAAGAPEAAGAPDAASRLADLAAAFAGQSTWTGLAEVRGVLACGMATFPEDGTEAQGLLRRAAATLNGPSARSGSGG